MVKTISIQLSPDLALDEEHIKRVAAEESGIDKTEISGYRILKRSIDARSRYAKYILQLNLYINEPAPPKINFGPELQNVANAPHVIIIGAGPAGLFAALKLITLGVKPLIIERGKDVRNRRRDLAAINKQGIVNPDSNYCFGEGGAGTYSDGKLYTRSTKRGDVMNILQLFHHFGADQSILFDAHPHIGTNKLPNIISAISRQIIEAGGEIHFETRLTDILMNRNTVCGIKTNHGDTIKCQSVILATGHSARDIFELLHTKDIYIESKPFALGVRIEHPQALIDSVRYHCDVRHNNLPPANYSLVSQENGKGVFSFCMCPGGIIAPAATNPGEIVVNGWSPSKRNNPFANSGTVVTVDEKDFSQYKFTGPLAAMRYQQMVEQQAYAALGEGLVAPAQRMTDFVNGKASTTLPECSYLPGVRSYKLAHVLPDAVHKALQKAIVTFGKKMKGYYTEEAILVATESRTSSPVRIPRDKESLQHVQIKGLYPCAEGAGYAGGIVSAAIDGERCAEKAAQNIHKR